MSLGITTKKRKSHAVSPSIVGINPDVVLVEFLQRQGRQCVVSFSASLAASVVAYFQRLLLAVFVNPDNNIFYFSLSNIL